jgi:hypothetical protein
MHERSAIHPSPIIRVHTALHISAITQGNRTAISIRDVGGAQSKPTSVPRFAPKSHSDEPNSARIKKSSQEDPL